MIEIFKCKICGNLYLTIDVPSHCSHCGTDKGYIVNIKDYEEKKINIDDFDRRRLEKLILTKSENAHFFKTSMKRTDDLELHNVFRLLHAIEHTQIRVFEELGIRNTYREMSVKTYEFDDDNISEAYVRKKDEIDFYKESIEQISDNRIKEIMVALIDVNQNYMKILSEYF